ncbi:MAG: NUDIX hydrolase [Chloroflexota bacterium]|nr:NUDIX hydrolase [Chloroflexota bacterium]
MGNGSETWTLLERKYLHAATTADEVSFVHDIVSLSDGQHRDYYFMDSPYRVVMVAAILDNKIALIRQHRYLFNEVLLELPAGSPQGNESLEYGARRELLEEAGLTALGNYYPAVGITNQDLTIFLATDISFGNANPDDGENIAVQWDEIKEAVAMVHSGVIKNESSALGILLAAKAVSQ